MTRLLIITCLLVSLIGFSQSPVFHVDGSVLNRQSKKPEANVKVEVNQNNTVLFSTLTSGDGKYDLKGKVDLKSKFDIVFKKDGFVSKKMSFDYTSMNNEDLPTGDFSAYTKTPIEIFQLVAGADFSFLQTEAVAKFYWNEMKLIADFDKGYNEKMKQKIESVFLKLEEQEKKIQKLITEADALFAQKKYAESLSKYEAVLALKPDHQHANERIVELDGLIQSTKNEELINNQANSEINKQKYAQFIKEGDQLFADEKWEEAKNKYVEAQKLDAKAPYPSGKIKQCDVSIEELKKEKEKANQLSKLIIEGNSLFLAAKYNEAKVKFNNVLVLDPTNTEAKDKLKEIEKQKAKEDGEAAQKALFIQKVNDGDLAVKNLDYSTALTMYEDALKIKQDSGVESKKQAVLKKIQVAEQQAKSDSLFTVSKNEGFKLATQEKWSVAKLKLQQALTIKQDAVVSNKLKEVENKLKEEDQLTKAEEAYASIIADAQSKESKGDLDGALAKYREALTLKPADKQVKSKIDSIESLKLAKNKQKELDARYTQLMSKGDEYMSQKNYLAAIQEYNQALVLKPSEKIPTEKAMEAERLEKEKSSEEDQAYEKILTFSQTKIDEKDYAKAKGLLDRAMKIRPADNRPKEMLLLIEKLIKIDKDFEQKMQEGEQALTLNDYKKAIACFQQAKVINPKESTPQLRIDEVNKLMLSESEKQKKETLYKDYMNKAGIYFSSKKYESALDFYQRALLVKENDQTAKDKIAELNQLLDEIELQKNNALSKKKQLDSLIALADTEFEGNRYLEAKSAYQNVLTFDKSNFYSQKRIEECERRLKQAAVDSLEVSYQSLIKSADDYLENKSYDRAKEAFQKALLIKANDTYVKKRLEEISSQLNSGTITSNNQSNTNSSVDNSIMDGVAALAKAEIERENRKQQQYDTQINQTLDAENQMSDARNSMQKEVLNELNDIAQSEERSQNQNGNHRDSTIEYLNLTNKQNDQKVSDDLSQSHAQNIFTETQITEVVNQLDVKNEAYSESAKHDIASIENSKTELENLEITQTEISQTTIYRNKKNIVNAEVKSEQSNEIQLERPVQNEEEITQSQQRVFEVTTDESKDDALNSYVLEPTKTVAENAVFQNSGIDLADALTTEKVVTEIDRENLGYYTELSSQESDRNQQTINYVDLQVRKDFNASEAAEQTNKLNIESVSSTNLSIDASVEKSTINDLEKIQTTNEVISIVHSESTATSDQLLSNENTQSLDVIKNDISDKDGYRAEGQALKVVESQNAIDNLGTFSTPKNTWKNSLGQEYPEGVSQETITQNDDKGLLISVITKRIVVINGHGDEYQRVQTVHTITYSKNGKPTTEYLWQTETQGPHLTKHY